MRGLLLCAVAGATGAMAGMPDTTRQAALVHMVREDCGSCHGLTLRGGLGPSLLPVSLQRLTAEDVAAVILHGRPGTPMPPFLGILDADEAHWIAHQLRQGFPQEPARP
ncbi:MAG TPA: cytochrome c [Rhodocyclaceae bacterium]|nr:cytochrome c [Rhodocyclaceae bacterium]